MESFHDLADEISSLEHRISDAIFDTLREQVRNGGSEQAKELERQLSKVRRSLQKAEMLLRATDQD
jgi:hypothetical protein